MASTLNQILGVKEDKKQSSVGQTTTPQATNQQTTQPQSAPVANQTTPGATKVAGQTTIPQGEVQKPTVEERMQAWKDEHPEPTKRTVDAPKLSQTYNYADIINQYAKAEQKNPNEEKYRKINKSIGAVGDTLSALINAVGVTSGANNMQLNPADGLSERWKKKYAEDDVASKDLRDKYFALMMKAAGLEDASNDRKMQAYNSAVAKADSDYNTAKRNWDTAYDRQARAYERGDNAEWEKQKHQDDVDYKEKTLTLGKQKLKSQENYQNKKLAIDNKRVDNQVKNDNKVRYRLGDWHSDRTFSDEELATVASRMFEAGLIPYAAYESAKMGLGKFGPLVEKAARTKVGARIMESNGFEKN